MAQSRFKQDMPPPGGYGNIDIKRVLPKSYFTSAVIFAGFTTITALSLAVYKNGRKKHVRWHLERNDTDLAIQPFLVAERDRAYMKHLRKIRDAEAEIMKDVPGWEVGTFYGRKVYSTAPPDYHMDPSVIELYVHNKPYDFFYQWHYATTVFNALLEYVYHPKKDEVQAK